MRKKKGNITDIPFVVVTLFIIGVVAVLSMFIMNRINTTFNESETLSAEGQNITDTYTAKHVNLWDGIFLVLLVTLMLSVLISAYFIDTHPAFFIVAIVLLIAFGIFFNVMEGTYDMFVTGSEDISTEANKFTIIPYVMQHFTTMMILFGILVAIVMYAKHQSGGGMI